MWEAIGGILKSFGDKHLIPLFISVAGGILAVLILPEDNWMIKKIGAIWVGVLALVLCFLIVEAIICIAKCIKKIRKKKSDKKYDEAQNVKLEKETMEKLWADVDRLSPGDRKLLALFIERNNEPLEESGTVWHNSESLFSSNWIVSTTVPYETDDTENSPATNEYGIPLYNFVNQGKTLYKLKDDIFQLLKYSKEKYGKISNFE